MKLNNFASCVMAAFVLAGTAGLAWFGAKAGESKQAAKWSVETCAESASACQKRMVDEGWEPFAATGYSGGWRIHYRRKL
ncbi:MAG: hypothetical protein ACO1SV_12345 [Fimbriimonas sp.]